MAVTAPPRRFELLVMSAKKSNSSPYGRTTIWFPKARAVPHAKRNAPAPLVEGAQVPGWTQALNALAIAYPGRIPEQVL